MVRVLAALVLLSNLLEWVHQKNHGLSRTRCPGSQRFGVAERVVEVPPRARSIESPASLRETHGSATQPVSESSVVL
jgi:hypothetical protein